MNRIVMALALVGTPVAGSAAIQISSIGSNPGLQNAKIKIGATTMTVGAGRFALSGVNTSTNASVSYLTYCIDLYHNLSGGTFQIKSLAEVISNSTKRAQLTALLTNTQGQIAAAQTVQNKKNISTAVQLAVWEIISEAGAYSLAGGSFQLSGLVNDATKTLANGYLTQAMAGSLMPVANQELRVLYNANNQSQVFIAEVPEPATWLMMILGFGLVGFAVRQRPKATLATAA